MKIKVVLEPGYEEDTIVIHCKEINEKVLKLQKMLEEFEKQKSNIQFFQDEKEYYFPLTDILFFETTGYSLNAHTKDSCYQVKYRLYELESLLPSYFVRISKSTIVNSKKIYSITKNLTSSSLIQFYGTHKSVYVSRMYFKDLKHKLNEGRNYEI